MLEKIREGSQGMVAKVILGTVILSFAMTGVYSYLGTNTEMVAAEVNGHQISRYDLDQAFQNEQARMRAQLGQMFDSLTADPSYMAGLRQNVLDRLIAERLLDQKAHDLGLRVSDEQIRQAIQAMPEFQVDGKYDNDRYAAVLRQSNLTGVQLRDLLRRDLTRQQLMIGLLDSGFITKAEAQAVAELEQQTRDLRYVIVSKSDFADGIAITDTEIEQYYQANLPNFSTAEEVSVDYVELSTAALADKIEISEQDAKAHYDSQSHLYQQPERRFAAHMLFEGDDAKSRADAALARVRAGESFAAVAAETSDDSFTAENGGDLDWMTEGQMDAAFDSALFALEQGQTSEVIQTEYGFQIVHAKTIEAGTQSPFADVKAEIITTLQQHQAQTEFYELQQLLADESFQVPDSLDSTAQAVGMPVQTSRYFTRNAPAAPFNGQAVAAAFSNSVLIEGMNSEVIQIDNGHILVLRVNEHKAAGTEPLANVSDSIRVILSENQAKEKALAAAVELETAWQAGTEPSDLQTVTELPRAGLEPLERGLVTSIFGMKKPSSGSEFGHFTLANGDIAVVALDKVVQGSAEAEQVTMLQQRIRQMQSNADYQAMLSSLRNEADIAYLELTASDL